MNIVDYFKEQLEAAVPITNEALCKLRSTRRETLTDEQYDDSIKAARLDTNELIGRKMLFCMVKTNDPTPRDGFDKSLTIDVRCVYDDELDQLAGLTFDRMNGKIPIFDGT